MMKTFCCAKCCRDLELPILAVLFPRKYLSGDALEFALAHGLDSLVTSDAVLEFHYNGMLYKIGALGLLRPETFLDANGQAAYTELEFADMLKKNVVVRLEHTCKNLLPNNACAIYDERPALCRNMDCTLRDDCTQLRTY